MIRKFIIALCALALINNCLNAQNININKPNANSNSICSPAVMCYISTDDYKYVIDKTPCSHIRYCVRQKKNMDTCGNAPEPARNIRLLFDAPIAYDDGFICNGAGKKDEDAPLVLVDRDDDAPQTEYETDEYVKFYPNPAMDKVSFGYKLNTRGTLTLVNLIGETVFHKNIADGYQNYTIDISKLSAGIYIYYILNEEGHAFYGKLVINK